MPVLLGTVLLLWLGQAWTEAGRVAKLGRADFMEASHGVKAVTYATIALRGFVLIHAPKDIASQNMAKAMKEIELCKAATRESEIPQSLLPMIDRLGLLCTKEAENAISSGPVSVSDSNNLSALFTIKRGLNRVEAILEISQALQEAIDRTLLEAWESQDSAQRQVKQGIIIAFGLILAIAVFLGWRFVHSLVSRLNRLIANTQGIGRQEKTLVSVTGNDELAYLNSVLIGAHLELQQAQADRKSILEMVAHDMRSPLMASQISLQIVQEVSQHTLPERNRAQLRLAQDNLSAVLQFIQNFLATEQSSSLSEDGEADQALSEDRASTALMTSLEKRKKTGAYLFSIPAKLLGLVLLPLSVLSVMLLSICSGMADTAHLDDLSRSKNRLATAFTYGADCLFLADVRKVRYLLTGNQQYNQLATGDIAKYRNHFAQSQKYLIDPVDRKNAAEFNRAIELEMHRLEQTKVGATPEMMENPKQLVKSLDIMTDPVWFEKNLLKMNQTLTSDEQNLYESVEKAGQLREIVQRHIYLFVPINIIIALILIATFTRSVTRRLNTIVNHARMLPKREQIRSLVSGNDELTYLDQVLAQTCAALIETEERRRQIMNSMARDIRLPMKQAQAAMKELATLDTTILPHTGRKTLPSAEKNIDRVLQLVDDLLAFEQLQAGKLDLEPSRSTTKKLAAEAINALSSLAATRGITLANQCEEIAIIVDEARLNQVLVNFITNAIKFSEKNTTITLLDRHSDDYVKIGVRDQGPGMDKKTAARVFDKFFQAEGKRKSAGFGLGLAICKLIVESHGGFVALDTEPGQGSTFWLSVPQ